MKMEVSHITELPSYLEGKPDINKTENLQQNQSHFFCRVQKQQCIHLQMPAQYVPEIAMFLRTWVETTLGVNWSVLPT